ncbi:MAG: hypothetical protein N2036_10900 [Bryobacteraceae bacterium]|nr:hypothetical protein [Bryobacteraceae bacterium]
MRMSRRFLLASPLAATAPAPPLVPLVPFGEAMVSRLIAGGNPVSGYSHQSCAVDEEMMDYFTAANVKKMLAACERAGINTWLSRADRHILRLLREYRNEGGRIQWIAQTAPEMADFARNVREAAALRPIGICLHGAQTDRLWVDHRREEIAARLKRISDTGVRAGLATHIPEVIDWCEDAGLPAGFYMACLYNLSRTHEEALELAGGPVTGEFFYEPDRARMLARVSKTKKQCIVFKAYGAGRRCATRGDRLAALREVFAAAGPGDCVAIGMFPKHSDQAADNAALVREILGAGPARL